MDNIINKAIHDILHNGGCTVNLTTGETPSKGYAVAINKAFEKVVDNEDANPLSLILKVYLTSLQAKLGDLTDKHLGAWVDSKDGTLYLDLSEVTESLEDALKKAKERNQLAIWDFNSQSEIRLDSPKESIDWKG